MVPWEPQCKLQACCAVRRLRYHRQWGQAVLHSVAGYSGNASVCSDLGRRVVSCFKQAQSFFPLCAVGPSQESLTPELRGSMGSFECGNLGRHLCAFRGTTISTPWLIVVQCFLSFTCPLSYLLLLPGWTRAPTTKSTAPSSSFSSAQGNSNLDRSLLHVISCLQDDQRQLWLGPHMVHVDLAGELLKSPHCLSPKLQCSVVPQVSRPSRCIHDTNYFKTSPY